MYSQVVWKIHEYTIKYGHKPDLLLLPAFIYEQLMTTEILSSLRTIEKAEDKGYDKEIDKDAVGRKAFGLEVIPHMGNEIIVLKKYNRDGGF